MSIFENLKEFRDKIWDRNSNLVANEENWFNRKKSKKELSDISEYTPEEQSMITVLNDDIMFDHWDISINKKTWLNIRDVKSISNLIIFFKWRLNEVLSDDDIENWVFYSNRDWKSSKLTIEQKAKYNTQYSRENNKLWTHIKINEIEKYKRKTKKIILENLKKYWLLWETFEKEDVKEYYKQFIEWENPEISENEIREALHIYYSKQAKYSYKKMISSHAEQKKFWERFPNIDKTYRISLTFLHIPEWESISYWLDNKVFNPQQLMHLKKLLKIDWLSLKNFKDQYPPINIDHRIQRLGEL